MPKRPFWVYYSLCSRVSLFLWVCFARTVTLVRIYLFIASFLAEKQKQNIIHVKPWMAVSEHHLMSACQLLIRLVQIIESFLSVFHVQLNSNIIPWLPVCLYLLYCKWSWHNSFLCQNDILWCRCCTLVNVYFKIIIVLLYSRTIFNEKIVQKRCK